MSPALRTILLGRSAQLPRDPVLALDLTRPDLLRDGLGNPVTTAGTTVAEVYDVVGGVLRANQITAGSRLTWDGVGIAGNGTGFMNLLSSISFGSEVTFVTVMKRATLTTDICVGAGCSTIDGPPYSGVMTGGIFAAATPARYAQITHTSTAFHCLSWRYSGPGSHAIRRDGVEIATTHGAFAGGAILNRLFARNVERNGLGSCVSGVYVWPRALSDAEMRDADRYAARRAGIIMS